MKINDLFFFAHRFQLLISFAYYLISYFLQFACGTHVRFSHTIAPVYTRVSNRLRSVVFHILFPFFRFRFLFLFSSSFFSPVSLFLCNQISAVVSFFLSNCQSINWALKRMCIILLSDCVALTAVCVCQRACVHVMDIRLPYGLSILQNINVTHIASLYMRYDIEETNLHCALSVYTLLCVCVSLFVICILVCVSNVLASNVCTLVAYD